MSNPMQGTANAKSVLDWRNVTNYGADPTGTNDSTTAFSDFTTAVGADGVGVIPSGTYKVTSMATFESSATYIFAPGAILLLNGTPQQRLSYYHPQGEPYNVLTETFASGSSTTTTGSIDASSKTLTLAAAEDFADGQGIALLYAGAAPTISAPTAATATAEGTSGSTTIDYAVAALDGKGGVTAFFTFEITDANATLNAANYVQLSVTAVTNAAGYVWLRTSTNGTSPTTTGYLGTTTATTLQDIGQATVTAPLGMPDTALSTATNDALITTILGGGGTTTLALADAATSATSSKTVLHDDTAAIKAAVGAANTAGGGTVILHGNFYVSGTITDYANVTIQGYGQEDTILASPAFVANGFTSGQSPIFMLSGATAAGIVLQDLTFDGTNCGLPQVHGILTNGNPGSEPTIFIRLMNCTFSGLTGSATVFWQQTDATVENCIAANCLGTGGAFLSTAQTAGTGCVLHYVNCEAYGAAVNGFMLQGMRYGSLVGCKGYNNTLGGITANGIYVVDYCAIIGCEVAGNSNAGIVVEGSYNYVAQTHMHGNALGIDCYAGSGIRYGNRIVDCISHDNYGAEGVGAGHGFSGQNQSGLTITGCYAFNNGNATYINGRGFQYADITDSIIANNHAFDNRSTKYQDYGLRIIYEASEDSLNPSANVQIHDNDFQGNGSAAMDIDSQVTFFAHHNLGYNPVGSVTVAAPSSGSAYTNSSGVALRIALSGATVSALTVAGATWPTSAPFILEPGEAFTPTYTGTLTVTALGE